jgi:hypothetical protein
MVSQLAILIGSNPVVQLGDEPGMDFSADPQPLRQLPPQLLGRGR